MAKKNTTKLLKQLRVLMKDTSYVPQALNAFIIPSCDAHQSEYIASCDQRRAFISGFTGSAGTAIVTDTAAALWTDGRYFLQASQELDSNWTLMKQGLPDIPNEAKWMSENLQVGSVVGADPFLLQVGLWNELSRDLQSSGHSLVPITNNLVDLVWADERPSRPANEVVPLEVKYTGKTSSEKIEKIRKTIKKESASCLIVTALDDVAYLFNLRGSDIVYNPVFFSYAAVTPDEAFLFIDDTKLSIKAKESLESGEGIVTIRPYDGVDKFIADQLTVHSDKIWISNNSSQAISKLVPKERKVTKLSPITLMKAIKNDTEIAGFHKSHLRDATALCRYFQWLEEEVPKGTQTEISAADYLQKLREEQDNFVGLSFPTISSVGPNASIIHYTPSPETNRTLTTDEIYLVDSGGQYKDGTTDVTRTLHFGTPSDFEIETFTRVLKGFIAVSSCVFPEKIEGNCLDPFARKALWDIGLDYGHGTGHGIGMYLNVHEGPMGISWKPQPDDPGLQKGMFLSVEPGYYEDGLFGIRIENICRIVKGKTAHVHKQFLQFKSVTMAPIQTKLIDPSMLTKDEIEWLNDYHAEVYQSVGLLLADQGHHSTHKWLKKATEFIG